MKNKKKIARKLRTPKEKKGGVPVFLTKAWLLRRRDKMNKKNNKKNNN